MEDASSWSLLQIHKDDRRIVADDTIIALEVAPGRVAVGGVMPAFERLAGLSRLQHGHNALAVPGDSAV
jgi:hypothetical protein